MLTMSFQTHHTLGEQDGVDFEATTMS